MYIVSCNPSDERYDAASHPSYPKSKNDVQLTRQSVWKYAPALAERLRDIRKSKTFRYRFHRRPDALTAERDAVTIPLDVNLRTEESGLVSRLMASYVHRSTSTPSDKWREIYASRHADIHNAITSNDVIAVTSMLRDPASNDLMYGFDGITKSLLAAKRVEERNLAAQTLDNLIAVAEAMGIRRLDNPEEYRWSADKVTVEQILPEIEEAVGFELLVPNPFPREPGLKTARGVMTYRVPQALYQAWRLHKLLSLAGGKKVLEIGPGLGRTALYARQFGIVDYTLVDIPISSLAQGYFLGRVFGEDAVRLDGEENFRSDQIKIISPERFFSGTERYDVVLNADSLTEIGYEPAKAYWNALESRAETILSLNHERNTTTIRQLMQEGRLPASYTRYPYWLRRGYVEEIIKF